MKLGLELGVVLHEPRPAGGDGVGQDIRRLAFQSAHHVDRDVFTPQLLEQSAHLGQIIADRVLAAAVDDDGLDVLDVGVQHQRLGALLGGLNRRRLHRAERRLILTTPEQERRCGVDITLQRLLDDRLGRTQQQHRGAGRVFPLRPHQQRRGGEVAVRLAHALPQSLRVGGAVTPEFPHGGMG